MDKSIFFCLAILIIIMCCTLIAIAIVSLYVIKYLENNKVTINDLKYKNIDIKKIDDMFDNVIEREFNNYLKFHPELAQEGSYIKREEINSIVTTITAKVYENITPAIQYNLNLIYNINDKDKLINLIGERIGILVMAMAAAVNSSLIDDTRVNIEV